MAATTRPIKTVYHRRGDKPQVNRSSDANRAVGTAVLHMQINQYASHVCEVYDEETGELHAQIKRSVDGTLKIVYSRDPSKYETRYATSFLIVK